MMNTQTLRQDRAAKQKALVKRSDEIHAQAEKEDRLLTEAEEKEIETSLQALREVEASIARAEGQSELRKQIDDLMAKSDEGKTLPSHGRHAPEKRTTRSLGEQFVGSDAYQTLRAMKGRRTVFATEGVEIDGGFHATTITDDSGSAGQLVVPQYLPGVKVPLLFWPLTVADLIPQGTTDSSSIKYMVESAFANNADTVSPGGTKPESALAFTLRTDEVEKIAHWIPVHDEMLEDVSYLRSTIDARLRLGVQLAEEDQLLNGSGTSPDIMGILNRPGITTDQARGADTNVDAIHKQITRVMIASLLQPDAVVIHPTNWETIALGKDANGQYYGPGPFAGPLSKTLWGKRVVDTTRITANSALVGAFAQAAGIFRKGGIVVSASNSHSDFFVKNLTAIRAEERLALAVYRPAAFGEVTGLN